MQCAVNEHTFPCCWVPLTEMERDPCMTGETKISGCLGNLEKNQEPGLEGDGGRMVCQEGFQEKEDKWVYQGRLPSAL